MTIIHILNYTIPIAFMVFFGFLLDRMSAPAVKPIPVNEVQQESQAVKSNVNMPVKV